ncbi:hypothetical protein [Azospirillum brasilense]|uniref:hypothetical protein n=1 Tax=Azospirillum brasilense TaxID=192 RepID=UPI000E695935|nr:hypothetical protein [Azospirillum brasilense]NUB27607.1 hypothetical protein [Azospirillum brasilense]NUB35122.1 hypothetical protein [Azospirillum brasilense]RIW03408.1 hypothetical protein D2T81_13060 [Azospirillum brasilense]
MVMLTEQFVIDYLLFAAVLLTVTCSLLGSFFLSALSRQTGALSRLLLWGVPATLLSTALWSLAMPANQALVVGVATAGATLIGQHLLPFGPVGQAGSWSWEALLFRGLSWTGRTALMLAPAVWLGGMPSWILWFALAGPVNAAIFALCQLRGTNPALRRSVEQGDVLWGGAQGAVLGGLPAFLMLL